MSLSRRTHSHTRRELKNTTETTDSHYSLLCGVQARETSRVLRSAASQLAMSAPPEGPAPRSACLDFSPRSPQECARDRLCERAPAVCQNDVVARRACPPQTADDDRRARPFPSPPSAAPPPGPQTDVVPHRPARVGSDPMLRWSPAASRHSRKRSKTTSKRHRGIARPEGPRGRTAKIVRPRPLSRPVASLLTPAPYASARRARCRSEASPGARPGS